MKFDELDARMRVFETSHDHHVLPGVFIVARLDGRSFTRLTRETCSFEAPYDPVFRDHMIETARHVMSVGFRVVYGYTQSDEISLLLHRDETTFGRKVRKLNSILAGEASAVFSLRLGLPACFDCRISQLPQPPDVVDYFRWRSEDAHRNALNGHSYWQLRSQGASPAEATRSLSGLSTAEKNELLFQAGTNFNELPSWQKRGVGLLWEDYEKSAVHPKTGEPTSAKRRRIAVDQELPMREAYSRYMAEIVEKSMSGDSTT